MNEQRNPVLPDAGRQRDLDDSVQPLPRGQILGSYQIRGVLGIGGFGITYRALDLHLKQLVALKEFLPVEYAQRTVGARVEARLPVFRDFFAWGKARFLEEARTLALFKHPNIVRVFSFFEANDTAYFAMDFEQGQNLKRLLRSKGTLEEGEAVEILLPLMDGLETMHGRGFIHRDIKPGNIYVRRDGTPVLLDFGAALRPETLFAELGRTLLTPGYAPPEQYDRNALLGPWTDIYGLAAVLYRCISGLKPVDSILRQAASLQNREDPLPSAVEQGSGRYSLEFLKAVDAGLALDPGARPQSIAAWRVLFFGGTQPRPLPKERGRELPLLAERARELEGFKRILLVGGQAEHARVDSVLLQTLLDLEVEHAAQGAEAVSRMQRKAYDAVLCDTLLADMEVGRFLESSARKLLWGRPPIIVMHPPPATDALIIQGVAGGAAGFIERPYAVEDLERGLQSIARAQRYYGVEDSLLEDARRLAAQGLPLRALRLYGDILAMEEEVRSLGEPGHTELCWQGMGCLARQEYVEAIALFARATGMLRLMAEARAAQAELHRTMGNMEDYLKGARKTVALARRHQRMLARRLLLAELLRVSGAENPFQALGLRLKELDDLAGALGAFSQALQLRPDAAEPYVQLAEVQARLGRLAAARAGLDKALRLDPGCPTARTLWDALFAGAQSSVGDGSPP